MLMVDKAKPVESCSAPSLPFDHPCETTFAPSLQLLMLFRSHKKPNCIQAKPEILLQ